MFQRAQLGHENDARLRGNNIGYIAILGFTFAISSHYLYRKVSQISYCFFNSHIEFKKLQIPQIVQVFMDIGLRQMRRLWSD